MSPWKILQLKAGYLSTIIGRASQSTIEKNRFASALTSSVRALRINGYAP
jgi:hypothetical protein